MLGHTPPALAQMGKQQINRVIRWCNFGHAASLDLLAGHTKKLLCRHIERQNSIPCPDLKQRNRQAVQ
jgi:hypothetical protein